MSAKFAPASQPPQPVKSWLPLAICAVLVVAILAVFGQVLRHDYVDYDDGDYVAKNEMVQRGLSSESVRWAFNATHASNWHPLTWLSHMLDWELYGNQPGKHHFTSVLIHAANTLLLFGLLRLMTGALWRSAFVAALFGLHPLHVESVAWLSERKDVLSTLFWMLTLWAYARYARAKIQISNLQSEISKFNALTWYAAALAFFALGLMSKPMLVTLPFVLLLLDVWPLQRISILESQIPQTTASGGKESQSKPLNFSFSPKQLMALVLEKIPFFALTLASCVITFQVQLGKTVQPLASLSLADRVSNVLVTYVTYLAKMFWPANLAFFYPLVKAPPLWQAVLAGLVLAGVTALFFRFARKAPFGLVGWFWYLGTLVPVVGLVHVGEQSHADRYTYIPLIGAFVVIVWGLNALLSNRGWAKPAHCAFAAVVLTACAALAWKQAGTWKTNRTMLERALAVTQNNFLAHNNYGVALANEGRYEEALAHYAEAIRIKPHYARAYNNYGSALTLLGRLDEAVEKYEHSLNLWSNAQTHQNFAVTLARQKRYDETIFHCREALRLNPKLLDVYYDLALAQSLKGESAEALENFLIFLKANPNDAPAHFHTGKLQAANRRWGEAIGHYREALRLNPDLSEAATRLAWILAACNEANHRNGAEAVLVAERAANQTGRRHPPTLIILAAAYAEAGRFEEAVRTAQTAASMAEAAGRKELAQDWRRHAALYQAGQAFREQP